MSIPVLRPPLTATGPPGPPGPEGPAGPPGPTGGAFEHDQLVPAAVWSIQHDLGLFPAVSVLDSAGTEVHGRVIYHDRNSLSIEFAVPFAGTASLT